MPQLYTIKLVESWTFLNEQRNPVKGYRVTFKVSGLDITDDIEISKTAYTPENVDKAITERVALHKALLSPE